MEKTIEEYEKELNEYTFFLNKIKKEKADVKIFTLATQAFYNCLAIAGFLSFSNFKLCLRFIDIAEKLMVLTGLNEAPDEMPYALRAIMYNCMQNYKYKAQAACYNRNGVSEKIYEKILIDNFSKIKQFNKYEFVGSQINTPGGDRIDILAKDIISKRPVIIELKIGDKSGHKQLRSYAIHYDNPILISISTETVIKKRHDIIYYVFAELHGKSEIMSKQLLLLDD